MPEIPDVIPGEPVASAWGNQVRDRATMRYDDLTDLEASEPLPDPGAVRWVDDPGKLVVWNGTAWVDIALPIVVGVVDGRWGWELSDTSDSIAIQNTQDATPWNFIQARGQAASDYGSVFFRTRTSGGLIAQVMVLDRNGVVQLRTAPQPEQPLMVWQTDGSFGAGRRFEWRRADRFGSLELWAVTTAAETRVFTCDDQGRFWPDALQSGGFPEAAGAEPSLQQRTGEADLYAVIEQLLDRIEALEGS